MTTARTQKQVIILDIVLLALLIIVVIIITTIYISSEQYFYFWDYANYSNQTKQLADAFQTSIGQGIKVLYDSLATDYNKLPCLPLVPFELLFGESRFVYILACVLSYLVPFALVMGAIATQLILAHPRAVFWSIAFLSVTLPLPWAVTLRGYPDLGAAVPIGLAVFIYFLDIRLRHWWQAPLMGVFLALAILFRRHYAYSARAFLGALVLEGLIIILSRVQNPLKKTWSEITRYAILVGLVAICSAFTLTIVAPTFTKNILTTDYRTLYASYERPAQFLIQRYGLLYGWLTWFLAILGFSIAILTRTLARPASYFLGLFGSLSLIQWVAAARQTGIHHGSQFSLFVILGLGALLWTTLRIGSREIRQAILGIEISFVLTNLVVGLTPIGKFENSFRNLFAESHPPLVRKDYNELVRLMAWLRETIPDQSPIYVAASSEIFNQSLVQEAEKQLYGAEKKKLTLLPSADVDSRDFYPLSYLTQAEYVVVARPFQYILPPQEQDVVRVVVDAFSEKWKLAGDFKQIPQHFFLERGAIISIFQRTRPNSLTAVLEALKMMQERIHPQPGNQSDWIVVSQLYPGFISKTGENLVNIVSHPSLQHSPNQSSFLYFGRIPDLATLTGKIQFADRRCIGLSLQLAALDRNGDGLGKRAITYSTHKTSTFSISISGKNAAFLLLNLGSYEKKENIDFCSVQINNLNVRESK